MKDESDTDADRPDALWVQSFAALKPPAGLGSTEAHPFPVR
jgi:hypothetical protein